MMMAGQLPWEEQADDLVGRQTELDRLRACVRRLGAGLGGAVALVGEPGIGKTRLMGAAMAEARAAAVPVLAAHSLLGRAGGTDAWDVVSLCHESPVLVALDDLHTLGTDALPRLEQLLELTTAAAVLLVVAYRERQLSPQLAATLSRATGINLLQQWPIRPLDLAEARQLLGERPDLHDIYHRGSGNPLYLKAIAESGAETSSEATTALLGELAELDEAELRVAQAAAVLGEPYHPEPLTAVAELSEARTLEALDGLTRLDLVRSALPQPLLAFRHPVLCQFIYEHLEPGKRLAAHLRAEAELARRGSSIVARAHHVSRAALSSRPDHVSTLIAAARETLHSAPATSADWLTITLRLIDRADERWYEAQMLLARAQLLSGRRADSRDLLHTLLPHAGRIAGVDLASTVESAGRAERMLGRYAEAGALVREGLTAQAEASPPVAAALHTELANLALDQQDDAAARRHAGKAADIAHRYGDRVGESDALAQVAKVHMMAGELTAAETVAVTAAELIDAAADACVISNLPCLHHLGTTEMWLDWLPAAERHLTRGVALSRHTGQVFILPTILKALGEAEFCAGHLRRADSNLAEAELLSERDDGPGALAIVAALRAVTLLWLRGHDDIDDALALAERAVAVADGMPWGWVALVRRVHAEVLMYGGDPRRGQRLLLDVAGGPLMSRLQPWRKPRLYDILALGASKDGDIEAAVEWAGHAETNAAAFPSPRRSGFAHRARMRVHGALGEVDLLVAAAERAVDSFSDGGSFLEAGRAMVDAATLLLDNARPAGVDGWLDRAELLARQCDSFRLAEDVVRQRHRHRALAAQTGSDPHPGSGVPAPGAVPVVPLAKLTEREREIATLAGKGMTNVGMARELYLSTRTVETHLSRIYRKLGLSNRAGLVRAVVETGLADNR